MSYEVLLLGLLVGAANYCFRYLPLRLRVGNARPTKRGAIGILLDTIGIASICALLVVSTAPEVMHDTRRFVPFPALRYQYHWRRLSSVQAPCPACRQG